ncbi:MAG: polysaccharide lyase family 8 super-sandwich domain-containing protein, partial [Verrucomicrobiota bacterium]
TWADLCEGYALGSVCLYARQLNRLNPGLIQVSNIDAWGNRIPDLYRNRHIDTNYMVPPNGTISADHLPFLITGANMTWSSQGIVLKYLTQSTNSVRLEGLDATFAHIWNGFALIGPKHESPTGWPVYTAIPQMSIDYMLGEHYTPYLLVYGGAYLNDILKWRNGMANIPRWTMPATNEIDQLFVDCLINGIAPVNQGYPDRVLRSRDLLGHSPTANLTSWITGAASVNYRTNELQKLLTWNNNNNPGTNNWPFTNHTFTHFYTSDYSSQHFPHFLVTFRGISERTCGIETLGGAFPYNRQVFMPLGGSFIYSNGNEYGEVSYSSSARDYNSSCDYTRIPGVTTKTVNDAALTNAWGRFIYGDLPFAGTVSADTSGASGWAQSRYVQSDTTRTAISLSGNMAVFYLDTAVVHLGAGYDNTQDVLPTTTSLDQRLSVSNAITYGLNGTTQTIPGTGGTVQDAGITWALYQGVGYLPPTNGVKTLRDVQQNGKERIFSFYADQSAANTNLTFDWAVLPGVSQTTLASYATNANRPWTIVTNTASLQALAVPAKSWLGAVFHNASASLVTTGLTITVSRPTVLIVTTLTNQLAMIYAADPFENMLAPYTNTNNLTNQLTVTINGKTFALTLPAKPYLGKTVSAAISLSPTNIAPVIITQPAATNSVAGDTVTFGILAAATPALTYQWQRNSVNIAGATNAIYSLVTVVGDNSASFRCVVSNSVNAVTSAPAILSVNDIPTISDVGDQVVTRNYATSPLAFTVNDLLAAPASLSVSATSSNPTLVPNGNIVLGGSGANRTATITPGANQLGYATIKLTVTDGALTASDLFLVTVITNLPPVLSPFTNRTVIGGGNLTVASQASDLNSPAQSLGFTLATKPSGANINAASGLITWRPLITQSGTSNQFVVVVTNVSGLSATQSFWAGVIAPQKPLISAPNMASGHFQFTISGDAGPDYTIQSATNLALPAWQPLFTNYAPVPPFQWTDTNAARPQSFYRVLLGP